MNVIRSPGPTMPPRLVVSHATRRTPGAACVAVATAATAAPHALVAAAPLPAYAADLQRTSGAGLPRDARGTPDQEQMS
ncbi:hypothetical protein DIE15_22050 [Burkholderia sp. Bp9031]|uniref:hypothetical protein n=1 Tax=Burkholderia sp. Bp9031 TaxID=2184566 RepID=UPI0007167840|nr:MULTISPECIES: hypothetical protein [Burkholderia]RQZ12820.1 hypothetical protein DIE15_22050 [Burkholderia sp. Bp9031]